MGRGSGHVADCNDFIRGIVLFLCGGHGAGAQVAEERGVFFLDDALPGWRHVPGSGGLRGLAGVPHCPDMDSSHIADDSADMRGRVPHCPGCHVLRTGAQGHPA